jgi:hypothetical protein
MLAAVPTFADMSLKSRAAAAINAIDTYPLTVKQRHEIVALAVWGSDVELPGPLSRAARTPDIDTRPTRAVTRERRPVEPPSRRRVQPQLPSTPDQRAEARRLLAAGWTILQIAEHLGQPWSAVQGWIRAKGG